MVFDNTSAGGKSDEQATQNQKCNIHSTFGPHLKFEQGNPEEHTHTHTHVKIEL